MYIQIYIQLRLLCSCFHLLHLESIRKRRNTLESNLAIKTKRYFSVKRELKRNFKKI